jgi:hypothetical protein
MKLDPAATLSQEPAWTEVLCRWIRWRDASRYIEISDGRSLVLPLVKHGSNPAALVLASMPDGWGMGGFVAGDLVASGDIDLVVQDLGANSGMGFRILPNLLRNKAWGGAGLGGVIAHPRFSRVLGLEGGVCEVWENRFRQGAPRNVRKAW